MRTTHGAILTAYTRARPLSARIREKAKTILNDPPSTPALPRRRPPRRRPALGAAATVQVVHMVVQLHPELHISCTTSFARRLERLALTSDLAATASSRAK